MIHDKYSMTVEENIFIAKRNIVDYIYSNARLDGIAVTFPDTNAIINGGKISNLLASDIVAVNNLKHAWSFALDTMDYPTNYPFICETNRIIGSNLFYKAGHIRNMPVTVGGGGGNGWEPPLPIEADIKDGIEEIMGISNATERSITLMLFIMRQQMFLDGNKRTAMLAANHEMIKNGAGIISIPVDRMNEFFIELMDYYRSSDMSRIRQFVFDNAIDGLDLSAMRDLVNEPTTEYSIEKWKSENKPDAGIPGFAMRSASSLGCQEM